MKGWKQLCKRIYSWISNGNNKVEKWRRSAEGVCTEWVCAFESAWRLLSIPFISLTETPKYRNITHAQKKLQIHTFIKHTWTITSTPAAQLSATLRSNCLHLLHMAYFFLRPTCFFSSLALTLLQFLPFSGELCSICQFATSSPSYSTRLGTHTSQIEAGVWMCWQMEINEEESTPFCNKKNLPYYSNQTWLCSGEICLAVIQRNEAVEKLRKKCKELTFLILYTRISPNHLLCQIVSLQRDWEGKVDSF